jgi:hypothetical protein
VAELMFLPFSTPFIESLKIKDTAEDFPQHPRNFVQASKFPSRPAARLNTEQPFLYKDKSLKFIAHGPS